MPSHSEAYGLVTKLMMAEGEDARDPVPLQLEEMAIK